MFYAVIPINLKVLGCHRSKALVHALALHCEIERSFLHQINDPLDVGHLFKHIWLKFSFSLFKFVGRSQSMLPSVVRHLKPQVLTLFLELGSVVKVVWNGYPCLKDYAECRLLVGLWNIHLSNEVAMYILRGWNMFSNICAYQCVQCEAWSHFVNIDLWLNNEPCGGSFMCCRKGKGNLEMPSPASHSRNLRQNRQTRILYNQGPAHKSQQEALTENERWYLVGNSFSVWFLTFHLLYNVVLTSWKRNQCFVYLLASSLCFDWSSKL